jgi:hypothetical protein
MDLPRIAGYASWLVFHQRGHQPASIGYLVAVRMTRMTKMINTDMQDKIAAIIGEHTDYPASHDDLIAAQILAAMPDILHGMIAPLIWSRNGSHWAGGHGYVIRKFGGVFMMTVRNAHDREFDTLEDAQAFANTHYCDAIMSAFKE